MSIINVTEFVTINSRNEKVQLRTYDSGHERCFIFQGSRWYPLERNLFDKWREEDVIIKEEDFLKFHLKAWGL